MKMNIFLQKMSKEIGESEAVVIMDSAGWHKSKDLVVPNRYKMAWILLVVSH